VQQAHLLEVFHFSMAVETAWQIVAQDPVTAFPTGAAPAVIGRICKEGVGEMRVLAAQVPSELTASDYVRSVLAADSSRFACSTPREAKSKTASEGEFADLSFHYNDQEPMLARIYGYTVNQRIVSRIHRRVFFGLELHVTRNEYEAEAAEPFYVAKVTFKPEQ
jgi:hypothetical protein